MEVLREIDKILKGLNMKADLREILEILLKA
jgi:hypothetical protein